MNAIKHMSILKKKGYLWVVLPDAINLDSNREIEKALESELTGSGDRIVLDMSHTTNLFSAGLGLIIRLRKRLNENGGALCLVNVSRRVRDMLTTLNLQKVIPVYATDVEFDISQEEFSPEHLEKDHFLFLSQIESNIYRINISGLMLKTNDLSPCAKFKSQSSIAVYIIDLSGLEMIDSTGAMELNGLVERIRRQGGTARVFGGDEYIVDLLNLLGISSKFQFYKDERSALEDIRK